MLVVARFLEELQPKPTVVSASRLELLYVASNCIIENSILRPWNLELRFISDRDDWKVA